MYCRKMLQSKTVWRLYRCGFMNVREMIGNILIISVFRSNVILSSLKGRRLGWQRALTNNVMSPFKDLWNG